MSELEQLMLTDLLADLELDTRLATTREQLVRATQRQLKLQRILATQSAVKTVQLDTNT